MLKVFFRVSFYMCLAGVLISCAGMADSMSKLSGLGVVSKEKSTFDGATLIKVSPTFLYDPESTWGNQVKLGARWSSKAPEYVALVLSYSSDVASAKSAYLSLTGIDINTDGNIESFKSGKSTNLDSGGYNTVSKTIYTESTNSVVVPYSLLQQMVSAEDCRVRIHTSKGYEEAIFSKERIPGGQGTAILSIREFIAEINKHQQST
ncbi:hypothetical protein [Marinibactrum halimedae]|uniref:Uncharacterized protein n=1 Tax=Marinibactrum halimedae TaxID=1444977 RepID=A0AA37T6J3_9GAMM|nr:hypothetical protein [Marinibactrum halimedae]MCD9458869.1 hypothetical protein [Marinibactrum halimedae]GLS27719.1 hypothetical protein GCM10007877_34380 [Marinibactrum halimedae]